MTLSSLPNPKRCALAAITVIVLLAGTMISVAQTRMITDFPELENGLKYIQAGEWNKAEEWLYDFVKAHPDHAEAWRTLALVELRRPGGDGVRAAKYIDEAMAREPNHAIGLFLKGKTAEVTGHLDKAAEAYDRLIELGPGRDDPPRAAAVHLARFASGLLAAKAGNHGKARDRFKTVLGREPQHAFATYEMGLIEMAEGNTDVAITWLQKTLDNMNLWAATESWPYPGARYGYVRENARVELAKLLLQKGEAARALEVVKPACVMANGRNDSSRRTHLDVQPSPLQGQPDTRFENAPYYRAEALAALGRTKEAANVFKTFSRFRVGDDDLRAKARSRRKEIR
jgi:tetratricopeptide (TPR) repeat protein